ncbi:MAG TPA: hypothetical protein DEG13_03585 [Candidatus Microthrix parvicella]|nr:hypothetical protein [Candidatus Microthrix parvicella]
MIAPMPHLGVITADRVTAITPRSTLGAIAVLPSSRSMGACCRVLSKFGASGCRSWPVLVVT